MRTEVDRQILFRYLLGDLAEQERERLEQWYFADPEVLDELHHAETELIDSYVCGALPAKQNRQFEEYYLDSESKVRRLEFARTLLAARKRQVISVDEKKSKTYRAGRAFLGLAPLVAALALVCVLAVFLGIQTGRLRNSLGRAQLEKTGLESQIQQLNRQLAAIGKEPVSILLSPNVPRSSTPLQLVDIPSGTSFVALMLGLRNDAATFRAVLQTPEGVMLYSIDGLRSHPASQGNREVILILPAQTLERGDYVVRLFRLDRAHPEELHPYSFTVRR